MLGIWLICNISCAYCVEVDNSFDDLDAVKVRRLLAENPDVVYRREGDDKLTMLHVAAKNGCKNVTELLLVNKADVDAKTKWGDTPLLLATQHGHMDVMESLLLNQADVNVKDVIFGKSPLHYAVRQGRVDIVEMLLSQFGG